MKIKVSEATNTQLDWLVARALGRRPSLFVFEQTGKLAAEHNYTTNWAQGGPIIEKEEIELHKWATDGWSAQATNYQFLNTPQEQPVFAEQYGPTPLIAAMRCYVVSKLGEEVEIPDELGGGAK